MNTNSENLTITDEVEVLLPWLAAARRANLEAGFSAKPGLEAAAANAERERIETTVQLVREARRLSRDLDRMVIEIAERGMNAHINPLGRVQGHALDIDRTCLAVHLMRERKVMLDRLVEDSTRRLPLERQWEAPAAAPSEASDTPLGIDAGDGAGSDQ